MTRLCFINRKLSIPSLHKAYQTISIQTQYSTMCSFTLLLLSLCANSTLFALMFSSHSCRVQNLVEMEPLLITLFLDIKLSLDSHCCLLFECLVHIVV